MKKKEQPPMHIYTMCHKITDIGLLSGVQPNVGEGEILSRYFFQRMVRE